MWIKGQFVVPKDVSNALIEKSVMEGVKWFCNVWEKKGWRMLRKPFWGKRGPHPKDPDADIYYLWADMEHAPQTFTVDVPDSVARRLLAGSPKYPGIKWREA